MRRAVSEGRQGPRAERVWDGRGEALADARLTIADGRMADDLRLTVTHYRIMAHVGRQNGQRGWLRVSQTELAERWACHRNTVNRAFVDLVAWGYLRQRTQSESGESFCLYSVALDSDDGGDEAPCAERAAAARSTDGGCTVESAPRREQGAVPGVHPCTTQAYTRAHGDGAPPTIDTRARRLTPTNADTTPTPTPPAAADGLGAGDRFECFVQGTEPVRFADGWTSDAQAAIAALGSSDDTAAVAAFVERICGTLRPPHGVDAVAWVSLLATGLRDRSPVVLQRLAGRVLTERVRDVPTWAQMVPWLAALEADLAMDAASAARAARAAAAERETLARLAPGVEPAATPQRQDALALRRVFVSGTPNGAALDAAWLSDVLVLDRTGPLLRIEVGHRFAAKHVSSSQLCHDIVAAARRLWPQIELVDARHRERHGVAA